MCFWEKFLVNAIEGFKSKGCNFNHIAEMNIIRIVNQKNMSINFYIKQNMHAVESTFNAMININEN